MSTIFNHYPCSRCGMQGYVPGGNRMCEAVVDDNNEYMLNPMTGEIIDLAVTLYDRREAPYTVCQRCAGYQGNLCEDDNEYHVYSVYTADTGVWYSLPYAQDYLYLCEECGDYYEDVDNLRYIGGRYLCPNCAEEYSVIERYHSNKHCFYAIGGTFKNRLIGLELETDGYYDEADKEQCARELRDNFGDAIVFEEDCSLDRGFEIITQPHTVEALADLDIESIVRTCLDYGAEIDGNGNAGLHMHFSRNWFGNSDEERAETIGRLITEYNASWKDLIALSMRESMCQINDYAYCNRISQYCDTYEDIGNASYARYCAINTRNDNTVEFRLGAGVLNAEFIRDWIRLHIQMIEVCRAHKQFMINPDYTITITNKTREAA